jgi:hypothetical protein
MNIQACEFNVIVYTASYSCYRRDCFRGAIRGTLHDNNRKKTSKYNDIYDSFMSYKITKKVNNSKSFEITMFARHIHRITPV